MFATTCPRAMLTIILATIALIMVGSLAKFESFLIEDTKKKVNDVLKTFDEDGDGLLDASEMAASLRVLGFSPSNADLELLYQQVKGFFFLCYPQNM